MPSDLFEHLLEMGHMVWIFNRFYNYVFHVNICHLSNLIFEHFVHHSLVCFTHVFQAEGHHFVGHESCLVLFKGIHEYMIIREIRIRKGELLKPIGGVYQLKYVGKKIDILRACLVEIWIVDAHSQIVVKFFHNHNVW